MQVLTCSHDGSIGTANHDGVFFPSGTKCRGSIKNRIFAPKWVREAWEKGLVVQLESIVLQKNESGRYYAIVRGKAVENKLVSTEVVKSGDYYYLTEYLLDGGSRRVESFHMSNWRKAPKWMVEHPEFQSFVRNYRLSMIWMMRYSKMRTSEVVSHLGIEKSLEIVDRHTVKVNMSYLQEEDSTYWERCHNNSSKSFVKKSKRELVRLISESYEVPTSQVFYMEVLSEAPCSEVKVNRWEYESNDGRSTRYEEYQTYIERIKTIVKFTPKEGWEWAKGQTWTFYKNVFSCPV